MSDPNLLVQVRIHINREPYLSPNPTTGAALYELAGIGPAQELFRELGGDHEDEPVARGTTIVHLTEDEHFYSQKEYRIIVNARPVEVATRHLTYTELVALAFNPVPVGPQVNFTITYCKGPAKNPKGTLTEGESVAIKNGMIFVVTQTNRS